MAEHPPSPLPINTLPFYFIFPQHNPFFSHIAEPISSPLPYSLLLLLLFFSFLLEGEQNFKFGVVKSLSFLFFIHHQWHPRPEFPQEKEKGRQKLPLPSHGRRRDSSPRATKTTSMKLWPRRKWSPRSLSNSKRVNNWRSDMRSEEEVGKFLPTPFNKSKS